MSGTVQERIEQMWERAEGMAKTYATNTGEDPEKAKPGLSDIVAVLVEDVAAISQRVDNLEAASQSPRN
jgi:hypothetical protein